MKKFHPAAAAVFIAGAVAVVFRHSSYSSHGPIDTGIFVVFLVFFWWLISEKTELAPAMLQPGKRAMLFDSAGF
ncbi:hypothetical protein [Mesorhizobium sp.]|nr:hypothetical protein [Mesorhizobium sp.]RWQ21114.1 MAG: hypothetical protein EOR93_10870 [Mesorhizobium sp.]